MPRQDMQLWKARSRNNADLQSAYTPLDKSLSSESPRQRWWQHGGYRWLVGTGAAVAFIVLLLNIVLLGWSSSLPTSNLGTKILFKGDCNQTSRSSILSHLVINILGTLLLAVSNAAMQCSSAPTRNDLDSAHAQGKWLHIGAGSMKNFKHISRSRKLTWSLLLLSSLPLHLL